MVNITFYLHLQPGNYGEGPAPLLAVPPLASHDIATPPSAFPDETALVALAGQKIPEGKCLLRIASTEDVYYAYTVIGDATVSNRALYLPAHCVEYLGIPADKDHDRYISVKSV